MDFEISQVTRVECHDEYDPPFIVIYLTSQLPVTIPRSVYDAIREPLGLPDILCGGS